MNSVATNFVYNVAYQILCLIMPLVTSPYLSRVLGAEQLGVYSYTYSIAYYYVLFAMLGVNNYGNRCIARIRDNRAKLSKTFWSIYSLQAILTVLVSVLYLTYSICIADDVIVSLIWFPYVISAGLDINWFFFGLEEFKTTVARNFAVKLATFVLMFVVVKGQFALYAYCLLMSVSYLASVAVLWPFVRRYVDFIVPSIDEVVLHLRPNLVLFVPVIAVSLYTVLDKVMLGAMSSMEQSGFFNNALNIAQMPFTLIAALGTVMLPRASNLMAKGDSVTAGRYLGVSMWLALLLSSAFMFGLAGVADVFVPVFYGPGFDECEPLICVIVLEMPFMSWANVLRTQYLIPAGRDRAYTVSVFAGAAVNIVVNILLIPAWGALGAAWGTTAAQFSVCLVQSISVWKELPQKKWIFENVPFFVIGFAMFLIVRFVGSVTEPSLILLACQVAVGVVAYSILSWAWCTLTRNTYYEQALKPAFVSLLLRVRNRLKFQ